MNTDKNPFFIGLAFPEFRGHNLEYYESLLLTQANKLDVLIFPEGYETVIPSYITTTPETIGEDSNVKTVLGKYAALAKKYDFGVIFGFEIDYGNKFTNMGGNDQYCAAISPEGNYYLYHKHSTSKFNAFFDANWSVENNIGIINLKGLNFGISICHDSYISLISRLLAKKGADIWVNITGQNVRPNIWEAIHLARAVDNNFISVCTLHRNSQKSNPQKEPYAFSPNGKIKLKDAGTNRYIDSFSEEERTGKIYLFNCNDYEVLPNKLPGKSGLSSKADSISIIRADDKIYHIDKYNSRFVIQGISLQDYFYPEVLWNHALQNQNKTVLFVVSVNNEAWKDRKGDVLKTIKARTIEFSTAFIFLGASGEIFFTAYRSSNYKDSRIFYPDGFPIVIDSRYLKGMDSIYKISLGDSRWESDVQYYEKIRTLIVSIESFQ